MRRRRAMLDALAEALACEPRDAVLSRGYLRALCGQGVAAAGGAPTAEAWEAMTGRLCAEVLDAYDGAYYVVEGGRYYAGALRAVVIGMRHLNRPTRRAIVGATTGRESLPYSVSPSLC